MTDVTQNTNYPNAGWRHATNAGQIVRGEVFGWREAGALWSGIVEEVDYRALRVKVRDVLPGVIHV